jgi:hypothetical protein
MGMWNMALLSDMDDGLLKELKLRNGLKYDLVKLILKMEDLIDVTGEEFMSGGESLSDLRNRLVAFNYDRPKG